MIHPEGIIVALLFGQSFRPSKTVSIYSFRRIMRASRVVSGVLSRPQCRTVKIFDGRHGHCGSCTACPCSWDCGSPCSQAWPLYTSSSLSTSSLRHALASSLGGGTIAAHDPLQQTCPCALPHHKVSAENDRRARPCKHPRAITRGQPWGGLLALRARARSGSVRREALERRGQADARGGVGRSACSGRWGWWTTSP